MICIYHANCPDGFGSAWVVRRACKDVSFFPGVYGKPPPDCTGLDVVLVDFSYHREIIVEMASEARSILILDHHLSAQNELVDLPENVTAIFDVEQSGAGLTWRHYFPGKPMPETLLALEDFDLWRFRLPDTREVVTSITSYPQEFAVWDEVLSRDVRELAAEGKILSRKESQNLNDFLALMPHRISLCGYDVPAINLPFIHASDAAGTLSVGEPFAVCYSRETDCWKFSLRSQEGGVDVSEIAARYGGGGHKHSAAFRLPLEEDSPVRNLLFR